MPSASDFVLDSGDPPVEWSHCSDEGVEKPQGLHEVRASNRECMSVSEPLENQRSQETTE